MLTFKEFFIQLENNVAGVGGVFGDFSSGEWSASGSHTNYAGGDTRIPKILGKTGKKIKKNGKKNKKSTKFDYFKR